MQGGNDLHRFLFEYQVKIAEQLPLDELRRHAQVSRDSHHYCQRCFCCACYVVMKRKRG